MAGGNVAGSGEVTRWEGTASLKLFILEAGGWAAVALAVVRVRDQLVGLLGLAGPEASYFAERNANELGLLLVGIVTTAAVARISRILWQAVGARTNRYRLSNRHLVVETGFLSKTVREINLRAVDDVMVHRSFLGRLVRVGEIAVVSSNVDRMGPKTRLRMPGVTDPNAVHDLIREAVQQATRA
jgi:hypothetical protein